MFDKFFSLKEANAKLPVVKGIVTEILERGKRLRDLLENTKEGTEAQVEALSEEIEKYIAQLEDMGCFYKDWNFEIGLVDFPCKIDGEEVFLCWRSDEGEVLWFHGVEDGYVGRRPLPAEWLLGDLFK